MGSAKRCLIHLDLELETATAFGVIQQTVPMSHKLVCTWVVVGASHVHLHISVAQVVSVDVVPGVDVVRSSQKSFGWNDFI